MKTNTLSKQYTAKFFATELDYLAFRKKWSELVNSDSKPNQAVYHFAYLVFCGKDWRKAFTHPTNKNKLENGYKPAIYKTIMAFNKDYVMKQVLEAFDGLITQEMVAEARKLVCNPTFDSDGQFTSSAYSVPETEMVGIQL